uniref:Uncharacterized protein n=1 Tax=Setaria italica TaxID=4555 RepID=K3Z235_SETIT
MASPTFLISMIDGSLTSGCASKWTVPKSTASTWTSWTRRAVPG